ncbi:MAG: zf-HC2 domain-containing protein [Bacteroidales bacterium]
MKCEDADKLLVEYLDGQLDRETSDEIEKHIATCEKCLDEVRNLKELLSGISGSPVMKPSDNLRINFYHMLHSEMNKEAGPDASELQLKKKFIRPAWYSIAAGIAILVAGSFIGLVIGTGILKTRDSKEISMLRSEIADLRKTAMMTMLSQESSSDRIQAVNYAEDIDNPDQNVIDVLVKTLNTDRNVNVRMAAAYALGKFSDSRLVCDSLVNSLSLQTDPLLQITLINILAERKVKNALVPVQKIISNRNTMKEVKAVAKNSLHYFI